MERVMNHYVYTTARGLCRTVHAQTPSLAWLMACGRHSPRLLLNLDGHAWVESNGNPACVRDKGADVNAGCARALYFTACLAEIPIAREEMPEIAAGKYPNLGMQRLLLERGLWDDKKPGLSDIGQAFAEWIAGGV